MCFGQVRSGFNSRACFSPDGCGFGPWLPGEGCLWPKAQVYDQLLFLGQLQPPSDLSSIISISSPVSIWVVRKGGMSSPLCGRQKPAGAGWRTRDAS